MYVITGATGNTGKPIASALLAAGKAVTVISRSSEKVQDLVDQGAIAAIGSLEDQDFLTQTFKGATAVYAMIPPNFAAPDYRAYQNKINDAVVAAVEAAGVSYVVTLSSIGAHAPKGTGVVLGLYDLEQKLRTLKQVHVLNLRAGFFMENFFMMAGTIKQAGVLGGFPIAGDIDIALVHTQDIAQIATKNLLELSFKGQSHIYVVGNRDVKLNDAAKLLGKAIGKPDLNYVQFPYDEAHKGMLQMGASEGLVNAYIEFSKSLNSQLLHEDYDRKKSDVVASPTSIEDFTATFAQVYAQA